MKFNLTPKQLKVAERSVYSQGGQDGVLEAIFKQIGEGGKMFFEAGARDGVECSNTANLRINKGWSGDLFDWEEFNEIVRKWHITAENINDIVLMPEYDLFSLDIDGNDFWVWQSLNVGQRVVCIEYNSKFENNESYAIEYNPNHKWDGDDYYSASLLALKKLGARKGYTLVYVVDRFDAIFIRRDLISPYYAVPSLDELLPQPIIAFDKISGKKWIPIL